MINRSLLSRMNTETTLPEKVEKAKPAQVKKPLLMVNPETGEVINTFSDIEDAVNMLSLSEPNILRAVKSGTKYKNALWKQEA